MTGRNVKWHIILESSPAHTHTHTILSTTLHTWICPLRSNELISYKLQKITTHPTWKDDLNTIIAIFNIYKYIIYCIYNIYFKIDFQNT